VGSSNYNARARNRDTELQMYLYSTCPAFNNKLDKEWTNIEKHCKEVSLDDIKKDEEIKYSKLFSFYAKMFSRFL
jgi:phosphatidylserine/phosphatidylglycerophosphate/cardiolipin synthase-like enzyme